VAASARPFGDIWIADVIEAWRLLGIEDESARAEVARALGFEYTPPVREQPPVEADRVPDAPAADRVTATEAPRPPDEEAPAPVATAEPVAVSAQLVLAVRANEAATPSWALVTDTITADSTAHHAFRPALEPLFDPRWARALIAALAATRVPEGPLDVPRVIEAIAHLRPLDVLPRYPVPTLRRGAQLLVDEGPSLTPLARDVELLVRDFVQVVGADRTVVLRFADHPGRGVRDPRGVAQGWPAPPPGTPVVAVSDFGLARGARRREGASVGDWTAFAQRVRAAGCPLVGIVPFTPRRWPEPLGRAVRLLRWDRTATVTKAGRVSRGERV
jgi:hypothetical protein